jgi:hypothetical protein
MMFQLISVAGLRSSDADRTVSRFASDPATGSGLRTLQNRLAHPPPTEVVLQRASTLTSVSVVDLDHPSTWPPEVRDHVASRTAELEGTTYNTTDLMISPEEEDEFRALLAGQPLVAYHATRLLDHEAEAIRRDGLLPLSEDLVRSRIQAAHQTGSLSDQEREHLLAHNLFAAGDDTSNRECQVSLFISRRVLDDEIAGIWRLLTTWGGEGIYFGSLDDQVEARLRTLGRPAIVVARIELSASRRVHLVFPGLLKSFAGRCLEFESYDSSVHYYSPIPGDQIIDTWLPGHPEYDQHTELPEH